MGSVAIGRFTVGLLVFLSWHVSISQAQTGEFLSIDCGATEQYFDPATGITWLPDTPYIKNGFISSNVTSQLHSASPRYKTLRYFPEARSKYCYQLPATLGSVYLVRATFLYGEYDGGRRKRTFQVHIDTVNVGVIRSKSDVIEVTMAAVADSFFLCLAPNAKGTDVPFINFIEVRALGAKMYPTARQGYMMINNYRYNFGGENISFPRDEYDRQWWASPISDVPSEIVTSSQNVSLNPLYSRDEAPVDVMNTALAWQKDFTLPLNVSGGRSYVVLLWLAEIDPRAQTSTREFEVVIDGNAQDAINIRNETGGQLYQAFEWGYASVSLTESSSIAFRATEGSDLGPLLNGLEVYSVSDPVQPRTDLQDVTAIKSIKTHWNLSSWAGDPCLNLPYDWTSCSLDNTPRITKLTLAGYDLTGSVPDAELKNLTELTVLWLENNTLTGSVPDLSALTKLQQLHLQNNNFTGEFPAWVANLPALQELFVDGNNLTGFVPPSLIDRPGLKFTYTPNPGLCTGTRTLCSPLSASALAASPATPPKSSSNFGILIGCVAGGVVLIAFIFFVVLIVLRRKQKFSQETHAWKKGCDSGMDKKPQTMAYSFNEVQEATNNFEDPLGEGSFGPVYKGVLNDGREVAAKRCRPSNKQGAADFFNEVELLSRIHHRNVASLVGYCQDGQEQILLYEYMSNSDLRRHLHGNGKPLPWRTRLSISLDTALGLEYLHTSCNPSIIQRDVKSANILLTNRMVAKVANFGFAKFTSEQDTTIEVQSYNANGTAGDQDPESFSSSLSTDVFGFGVVLLELVSGRESISKTVSDRNPRLIEWMRPLLGAGDLKAVVDSSLGEKYNLECMWKVAELGMMCVEPKAANRPTITDVVREIRDAIAIEETVPGPTSTFSLSSVAARGF